MHIATLIVEVVPIYGLQRLLQAQEIDHEVIESGARPVSDYPWVSMREDPPLLTFLGSGGERPVGRFRRRIPAPSGWSAGGEETHRCPREGGWVLSRGLATVIRASLPSKACHIRRRTR